MHQIHVVEKHEFEGDSWMFIPTILDELAYVRIEDAAKVRDALNLESITEQQAEHKHRIAQRWATWTERGGKAGQPKPLNTRGTQEYDYYHERRIQRDDEEGTFTGDLAAPTQEQVEVFANPHNCLTHYTVRTLRVFS